VKKGSLLVLFLAVFIDLLGFGIVVPLLAYYAKAYGASGFTLGMILGSYSLMQFFFSPVWGKLSDRIGRRPVLIGSLLGNVAGYALFAISTNVTLLMISRIVSGIAAANIVTAQAYVADTTTLENRAKGMGLIGAAFGLGFIFGPPVGGVLAHVGTSLGYGGNLLPGLLAATASGAAVIIAFFHLPESKSPDLRPRSGLPPQFDPAMLKLVASNTALHLAMITLFLMILAFSGMEPSVVLYGRDHFGFSAKELGYFFGFMGVIVAAMQGGAIGLITKRIGDVATATLGASSLFVGMMLIPLASTIPALVVVSVFIAIGQSLVYPSLTSHLSKLAPEEHRGSILGISTASASLSRVFGPILAGVLYDGWAAQGAFWGLAAGVLVGILLSLRLRRVPGSAA
jgi:MFS transporter, DHA1 family, tetracycline resistance protein